MFYVILQKDPDTEQTKVHSVFEDEGLAVAELDKLIDTTSYAYRMDVVGTK